MTSLLNIFFSKTFLIFLIIGGLNFIFASFIMLIMYNMLHTNYWISSASAFAICSIISFICNRKYSFKSTANIFNSAIKFFIVIAVCYFLSFGIAKKLTFLIIELIAINISVFYIEQIAMIMAQCFFMILNFIGQKYWVFGGTK